MSAPHENAGEKQLLPQFYVLVSGTQKKIMILAALQSISDYNHTYKCLYLGINVLIN